MKSISIACLVVALSFGCATEGREVSSKVRLTPLRGPLYILEDAVYTPENSMVYIGKESVTIIGATWTPETAKLAHDAVRAVTSLPVRDVIVPDFHTDRSGGTSYWQSIGAKVHCTAQTAACLSELWPKLIAGLRGESSAFPDIPMPRPDTIEPPHFTLENGAIEALYLGAAHTPDGIFVYFPADRVLYAGCIIKEFVGNLDDADLEAYPQTIDRLVRLNLDFDLVVAGHGKAVHQKDLIPFFQALLKAHPPGSK